MVQTGDGDGLGLDPAYHIALDPAYHIAFDGDCRYYVLNIDWLYKSTPGLEGIVGGFGEVRTQLNIVPELKKWPQLVESDRQLILQEIRKVIDEVF